MSETGSPAIFLSLRIEQLETEVARLRTVVKNHEEAHRVGLDHERALALKLQQAEQRQAQAVAALKEEWMLYVGQPGDPTYEAMVKENTAQRYVIDNLVQEQAALKQAVAAGEQERDRAMELARRGVAELEHVRAELPITLAQAVREEMERCAKVLCVWCRKGFPMASDAPEHIHAMGRDACKAAALRGPQEGSDA